MKKPDSHHDDVRAILKKVFPPVASDEPLRDLWPLMLRRLNAHALRQHVPWYDWALLGALAGTLAVFPGLILVVMYHL
jgi:hypothetical protein